MDDLTSEMMGSVGSRKTGCVRSMVYKKYDKKFDHSYSLGIYPTTELIQNRPEIIEKIVLHSKGKNHAIVQIVNLCNEKQIRFEINDKLVHKLSTKDNCYAIGIFKKRFHKLAPFSNHIVLDNPSDMGNIGTIIRTVIGFGITNLGIVGIGADVYDPKVIRSSMGSIFKINIQHFKDFREYTNTFNNDIYTFRLNGKTELRNIQISQNRPYTLVFGNEGAGLSKDYSELDNGIFIRHTQDIDSLNVSVAVGIAVHHFSSLYTSPYIRP